MTNFSIFELREMENINIVTILVANALTNLKTMERQVDSKDAEITNK